MVICIAKRLSSPYFREHQHITHLKWFDESNGQSEIATKEFLINWLEQSPNNKLFTKDSSGYARVLVVNATPKYLRSYRDNRPTDNLLELPDC